MTVYLVHGFRFDSEIPLSAPQVDGPADVRVRWGEALPVGRGPGPGELLAEVDEDGAAYWVTKDRDGLLVRIPGLAEFRVGEGTVTVHPDPGADRGMAAVLLSANLPAVLHTAAGTCVIHASAVAFEDGALGFVGGSGAGKSTLSALCCAAGARLVSEDLLRVRFDGETPVALPGIPEVRLRPQAADLAGAFDPSRRGTTADDRTTVSFEGADEAPLAALLFPLPTRDLSVVRAERLAPAEALVELGRHPRVLGWRTPEVRAARFRTLARLARTVPVARVLIPWGPPFAPDLVEELRAAGGLVRR
jgi:hypothetical protein